MSTPSKSKTSCTMLVTRPAHQAGELAALIQSSGNHVYQFPGIEIGPTGDRAALLEKIPSLSEYDYAFFISPNAVTYALDAVVDSIGALPPTLKLACIGAGTIAALNKAGYQCQLSPVENFNSEALLALPELQDVKGKKIVIFRGNGGRDKLRNELLKRGAHVDYMECYQRSKPETDTRAIVSELEHDNIDIISFTSADAARNIAAILGGLAGNKIFNLPVIVVSQRIADVCRETGYKGQILLAENANNEAIIKCMTDWLENTL